MSQNNMTHRELIDILLTKKIAVLAGAGISFNSGLPVVSAFYDHFLPLFYEPADVSYLRQIISNEDNPIPFERMMEHIFQFTGEDYSIMNVFANGEPNALHDIIAMMMKLGWADEIYTTNFDCLIEKSLEAIGTVKEQDYGYHFDENGFLELSKSTKKKNVIKIHGTIDDRDSIRTTLETITSRQQLEKRKYPVERLFSSGTHDVVLILGYSFSDIFDVNEFLKKMDVTKTIIRINHKGGVTVDNNLQSLREVGGHNPFLNKRAYGHVVNIDTLSFMSELCKAKYLNTPSVNPKSYDWRKFLDDWALKFGDAHKSYISGGIYNSLFQYIRAKPYLNRAFKSIEKQQLELYLPLISAYVWSHFNTRNSNSECDELISLCVDAISLLEQRKLEFTSNFYYQNLGILVDERSHQGRRSDHRRTDRNRGPRVCSSKALETVINILKINK